MRSMRQGAVIAGVAMLALAAGFGLSNWLKQLPTSEKGAEPGVAEALLTAPMMNLENQPQKLDQYRGKVLVVNFWATWCPPCREEIPLFIQTQQELSGKGVQFAGIALDDPQQTAAFVQEFAVNYPVLIGGINESEALHNLGNPGGGLPYTLIYDRSGALREKIIGGLDKRRLQQALAPYL
jgi:thiol-disulfide isomerase/thioredoxin